MRVDDVASSIIEALYGGLGRPASRPLVDAHPVPQLQVDAHTSELHRRQRADRRGRAVQVDPTKPQLKPPSTERLKLQCDVLLSNHGFKCNLRCYSVVTCVSAAASAVEPTRAALHFASQVGPRMTWPS
jgi:hypothetical protein